MLGSTGVTEQNIMQYLGIIEQRTNEILQMYASRQQVALSTGDNYDDDGLTAGGTLIGGMLGNGPAVPSGSQQVSVTPPDLQDAENDRDSGDEEEMRVSAC